MLMKYTVMIYMLIELTTVNVTGGRFWLRSCKYFEVFDKAWTRSYVSEMENREYEAAALLSLSPSQCRFAIYSCITVRGWMRVRLHKCVSVRADVGVRLPVCVCTSVWVFSMGLPADTARYAFVWLDGRRTDVGARHFKNQMSKTLSSVSDARVSCAGDRVDSWINEVTEEE